MMNSQIFSLIQTMKKTIIPLHIIFGKIQEDGNHIYNKTFLKNYFGYPLKISLAV